MILQKERKGKEEYLYSAFSHQVLTKRSGMGGLKTQDWKTRHGQNCRTGKRNTGKRGTRLQDWKTREKACMES